jgi:hypothetical protein
MARATAAQPPQQQSMREGRSFGRRPASFEGHMSMCWKKEEERKACAAEAERSAADER